MVLGLVAHRVPRSGLGARRQTGRSPANSFGTVLLPYPRSLAQDVPFSSQRGARPAWRERAIWGRRRARQPPGRSPAHLPSLRTHSDARRNARRCGIRGHSAAIRAARINSGPQGGRCIGSTGLAGSPRRPRIMEGPLVSDTTELLSGAPGASEDAPVGTPAPSAAAGGSAKGAPERRHRHQSRAVAVALAFPRCSCPNCSASRSRWASRGPAGCARGSSLRRSRPGRAERPGRRQVPLTKVRTSASRPRELTRLACGSRTLWNQTHARSLASETVPRQVWAPARTAGSARTEPGSSSASTSRPWPTGRMAGPSRPRPSRRSSAGPGPAD